MDESLAVAKVTKITLRKGEGGGQKASKKPLRNVQIRHVWKWIWRQIK